MRLRAILRRLLAREDYPLNLGTGNFKAYAATFGVKDRRFKTCRWISLTEGVRQ